MWIEIAGPLVIGFVWVAAFTCVLRVSRWLEKNVDSGRSPGRLCGWMTIAFGFLGMCVWGPSLGALIGSPELFVALPIGLFPGLLVGYCAARIIVPLFHTETTDELDQETEDARD